MNREALDEFFAKADDVLADWHGGTDAMHARVPDGEPDLAMAGDSYYEHTPFGGYRQRWLLPEPTSVPPEVWADWAPIRRAGLVQEIAARQGLDGWAAEAELRRLSRAAVVNLNRAFGQLGVAARVVFQGWSVAFGDFGRELRSARLLPATLPADPRQRVLEARRTRNTGPSDRRGLDEDDPEGGQRGDFR